MRVVLNVLRRSGVITHASCSVQCQNLQIAVFSKHCPFDAPEMGDFLTAILKVLLAAADAEQIHTSCELLCGLVCCDNCDIS